MPGYERHVFVCVNQRAKDHPRGCCKDRGGDAVRTKLKRALTAHGLNGRVRANNAGCLDHCEHGVTVVVYPEQVWYGGVTVDDVPEIVSEHILAGRYVTRLMLPEQNHLQGATSGPPLAPNTGDDGADDAE